MSRDEHKSAIYVGSTDAKPEQQNSKPLLESGWKSKYAPSSNPDIGYLLFLREGTLMAQPFDHRRLELTGQPAPVAERVNDGRSFSVSKNNVLVFHQSADLDQQPTWYDRAGKVLGTVGEPGDHVGMALSPDGARLAVTNGKFPANPKLWLLDLSRGGAITRFTSGSAKHSSPVWSPDGRSIIFGSDREGSINLYRKPADGVKEEELLLKSSEDKFATSWSPDGRFLLYTVLDKKTKLDLWVLPLEGDKKPHRFLNTEFNEAQARLSPDGHWVAYSSDESGRTEIYVRSFSLNSAATATEIGGKLPISNGVGFAPHWRGDGKELNYMTSGGRLMAVEIATNPVFQAGTPQPLGILPNAAWDAARDGKRFLGLANRSAPQPYTVILNWQAGLKK